MLVRPPGVRFAVAGLALVAVVAGLGCGTRTDLKGRRPVGAGVVGHLRGTEVLENGSEREFAFHASSGKLLFVTFGYTSCPDICPTTLSDLRRALREIGPLAARVEMAFVTVDVNRDTAGVLVPYVRAFVPEGHAIRPRNQRELGPLEAGFNATSKVTKAANGAIEVVHTGTSYLVDEQGRIQVEWPFGIGARDMAHDLRVMLESRAGR